MINLKPVSKYGIINVSAQNFIETYKNAIEKLDISSTGKEVHYFTLNDILNINSEKKIVVYKVNDEYFLEIEEFIQFLTNFLGEFNLQIENLKEEVLKNVKIFYPSDVCRDFISDFECVLLKEIGENFLMEVVGKHVNFNEAAMKNYNNEKNMAYNINYANRNFEEQNNQQQRKNGENFNYNDPNQFQKNLEKIDFEKYSDLNLPKGLSGYENNISGKRKMVNDNEGVFMYKHQIHHYVTPNQEYLEKNLLKNFQEPQRMGYSQRGGDSYDRRNYNSAIDPNCSEENSHSTTNKKRMDYPTNGANFGNISDPNMRSEESSYGSNAYIFRKNRQGRKTDQSDDRPFRCDFPECKSAFKRFEHLKRHMKIHTGEREFHCGFPGCFKSFARSDNLNQHQKLHKPNSNSNYAKYRMTESHYYGDRRNYDI